MNVYLIFEKFALIKSVKLLFSLRCQGALFISYNKVYAFHNFSFAPTFTRDSFVANQTSAFVLSSFLRACGAVFAGTRCAVIDFYENRKIKIMIYWNNNDENENEYVSRKPY